MRVTKSDLNWTLDALEVGLLLLRKHDLFINISSIHLWTSLSNEAWNTKDVLGKTPESPRKS